MSVGRVELTLSGVDVCAWTTRHVRASDPSWAPRFGSLVVASASLESLNPERGRVDFHVLGPADPINSLEMAQVVIEQIALLPDAELLAQSSIELRIIRT